MYNIEGVLLRWGFKKIKEYDSGVIVYSDRHQEDLYSSEVALFTCKDPKVWEITIHNPYSLTLLSYREQDRKEMLDSQLALIQDYVDCSFNIYDNLKTIEDPWGRLDDNLPSDVNVGSDE